MNTNEKSIKHLNTLLTRCYDSEKGYTKAAEDIDNPGLTNLFTTFSEQRNKFGHDIKSEIRNLGGDPDKGTSVAGDLHRAWIDVKTAFTSGGEESVLEECIRGEKSMIDDYEDALKDGNLPTSTQTVARTQLAELRSNLDRIKRLEEVFD